MQIAINPEWEAAGLELKFVKADGSYIDLDHPMRFRSADLDKAMVALGTHDGPALDRLAIRKFVAI